MKDKNIMRINRESVLDAKMVVEKFLPDIQVRRKFINFLGNAISFANAIKPNNWNLNLDKSGNFLRFNVGHEYCIELTDYELLILCDRTTIKYIVNNNKIPILFRGHKKRQRIENTDIDKVSDCLAKTKNSIGCILSIENIFDYIDFFAQSNKDFILSAMNTYLMPQMQQAHSKGAVEYIFAEFEDNLTDFSDFIKIEEQRLSKAKTLTQKERLDILSKSNKKPIQTTLKQTVFQRNSLVVAEILFRANGYCEKCKQSAPFLKDTDGTPYLEVHHKIPLAENGDDTVENAVALCPNCHRQAHFGKNSY